DGAREGEPTEGTDVRGNGDGGNGATGMAGGGFLRGTDCAPPGCPRPEPGGSGASYQRGLLLPEGWRFESGREPLPGGPGRPPPPQHAPGRRGDARRLPGRIEPHGPERLVATRT